MNIFTLTLKDQQGRLIQLNNSNFDLSFLLEIYERDVIVTENRRSLIPENAPPLPITLDAPDIPDFSEEPPDLNEIVQQAETLQPQILPPPTPPILSPILQQRSQPVTIPTPVTDYSSHELADVLLKAQYLKLKNLI